MFFDFIGILSFSWFLTQTVYASNYSFLVIGDWGTPDIPNVLKQVSSAMNTVADTHHSKMVVAVGDNFYEAGVSSTKDVKWNSIWKDCFTGTVGKLPWYAIMGNHDWLSSDPNAQIDYSKVYHRWNMPDYFYDKVVNMKSYSIGMIFIDTNLMAYGYNGTGENTWPGNMMKKNFETKGWTQENNVLERQYKWFEEKLKQHQDKEYLFVLGHHDIVVCPHDYYAMDRLQSLMEQYRVTAYVFGHHHAFGVQRISRTLYVETGNGGQQTHKCPNVIWGKGHINGFVHINVQRHVAGFDFIKSNGETLHTEYAQPRF